jgi:uncharacterized membrane protein
MTRELIDTLGAALEVAGVALLIGGLLLALVRSLLPARAVRLELGFRQAQDDRLQAASTSSARTGSGSARTGSALARTGDGAARYLRLRHDIGRSILLGLEVLVAADIVRSVTLAPTMGGLTVLATLVVIRTFLSWSLALELDGRWPWQRPATNPALPLETTP